MGTRQPRGYTAKEKEKAYDAAGVVEEPAQRSRKGRKGGDRDVSKDKAGGLPSASLQTGSSSKRLPVKDPEGFDSTV